MTMLERSHSRPRVVFRGAAAVATTDGELEVEETTAGEDVVAGEVGCELDSALDWVVDSEVSGEVDADDWAEVWAEVSAGAVVEATTGTELVDEAGTLMVLTTVPVMPVLVMVAVATGWPSE